MNKKYIIRKNEEIQKIVKESKNKIVNKFFIVFYSKNNLNYNRYCISVSKKIGKANIRNLIKRRIKDILMKNVIDNSNDYVIILRKEILDVDYSYIKNEIVKVLKGEK